MVTCLVRVLVILGAVSIQLGVIYARLVPANPFYVTCCVVIPTLVAWLIKYGDPLLSLSAIGARRPVVVCTMTPLMRLLLAQKTRPNRYPSSLLALPGLFLIMCMVLGLRHRGMSLVTRCEAPGESLEGPR